MYKFDRYRLLSFFFFRFQLLRWQYYSGFWATTAVKAPKLQTYQYSLYDYQAIWHWCYCRYCIYSCMSSCILFYSQFHFINILKSFSLMERQTSPTLVLGNWTSSLPQLLSQLQEFSYPSWLNMLVTDLSNFVPKRRYAMGLPQMRRNLRAKIQQIAIAMRISQLRSSRSVLMCTHNCMGRRHW